MDAGMCRAVAKIHHPAVRWSGPGPDPKVAPADTSRDAPHMTFENSGSGGS